MSGPEWNGDWVSRELGVELIDVHGENPRDLVGLALRRNPKRAHLLVSTVLGKHLPALPGVVLAAGKRLAERVNDRLGTNEPPPVVIGYAETATALGHVVAHVLGGDYLHSTRHRSVTSRGPDLTRAITFEEEHSHATSHLLLPSDQGLLRRNGPIVLVDDEMSTGRTALNTIAALHRVHARDHYVLATLVDARDDTSRAAAAEVAHALGVRIDTVSLSSFRVDQQGLPGTLIAALLAGEIHESIDQNSLPADVVRVALDWVPGIPLGGRHGFLFGQRHAFDQAVLGARDAVLPLIRSRVGGAVHVLGTEELMYLPLRIADALQGALPSPVTFSTTTRSPVAVVDEPGYAIRHGLRFAADGTAGQSDPRFAYNLPANRFQTIVLVLDEVNDEEQRTAVLVDRLSRLAAEVLVVNVRENMEDAC